MRSSSHLERPASGGADLFRWICTKNPFYAISAALVLAGLWVSFGKQDDAVETWLLMGGLAAYTLLLAATALLLVRYLKVWDDARTVLLLVVLMFLATSVTFDHVLAVDPVRGVSCCLLGLGLSIFISEALLRAIRLRLPILFRVPFYLILALFFLYPIFVRTLMDPLNPVEEPIMWGLFGFSSAAALVVLTLLPAVRRGHSYVRDNGSPWPWPLYPWSLFVVLAVAVPGRAIFLCWSMHPLDAHNWDRLVFGPYFLVPFGFALAVLLLEMGFVSSRRDVLRFALVLPIVLIGLALLGHGPHDPVYRVLRILTVPMGNYSAFGAVRLEPDPIYGEFLAIFSARLGADPLFLTLALGACFYGYAALRRVPLALDCLTSAVAALAFIPTNGLSEGWLTPPEPAPLLIAGSLLLALGFRRHNVWNHLAAAACLLGAVTLLIPLPETLPAEARLGIFVHALIVAMFLLGAVFTNPAGQLIRGIGAGAALVLAFAVMHEGVRIPDNILPYSLITYPLIAGIVLAIYGQLLRDSFAMIMATLILGYWVFKFGWTAYRSIRTVFRGLDYIVWGAGFFMVALLVSLGKSGVLLRWIEARWGIPRWLRPTPAFEPTAIEPSPDSAAPASE